MIKIIQFLLTDKPIVPTIEEMIIGKETANPSPFESNAIQKCLFANVLWKSD